MRIGNLISKIILIIISLTLLLNVFIPTLAYAVEENKTNINKQNVDENLVENQNVIDSNETTNSQNTIISNEVEQENITNNSNEDNLNNTTNILNNEKNKEDNNSVNNISTESIDKIELKNVNDSVEDSNDLKTQIIGEKVIEEGTYEMHSAIDDNKLLDVEGQSLNSGANIYIYQRSNVKNQKFKFIYNEEDGTYTIISINSGKALDVQNGGTTNGTNVWQYDTNNTDAQKWIAVKNSEGTYNFISKLNGLLLDVSGGGSNNCTNVQVYEENGTNAQKFRLSKVYDFKNDKLVKEDTYNILLNSNTTKGFDVSGNSADSTANIQIWGNDNAANQKFKITYNELDDTYTIMAVNSGKVLDVQNGGMVNYTNVWQYDSNGTDAQKWIMVKNQDDTYSFISKLNGLALDVSGGSTEDGANVQVYEFNESNAQKFVLQNAYPMKGTKTLENGLYEISCFTNPVQSFDITDGKADDNVPVQLWYSDFFEQQKFYLEYDGNGYYKIRSKLSNKVLSIESENPSWESQIIQEEDKNLDTQKWLIKSSGEKNIYYIYTKCNNLCIDIPSGNTSNGAKPQLWGENGNSNQKFVFIKRKVSGQKTIEDGIYKINLKNNKVFDIDGGKFDNYTNLQTWDNSDVQQQKFRVKYNGDGTYTISAIHSAKSLDVQNGGTAIYTNVDQYELNNTINQKWIIQDTGNGYYNIISQANGLYIDISGGLSNNNGTNIQLYYDNGSDAQQFKFTPINIIDENSYQIQSTINPRKVLDVSGGSQDNYANVQLWDYSRVPQQSFKFQALSNEEYTIIADHSNKALDVQNGGTEPGTNVCQFEQNGTENQKWIIREAGNDSYYIISAANGLCLDAESGQANNGTNIQVYTQNYTNAQKFKITHSNEIVIVLNPGHGGYETGCANNSKGLVEKNVTLQIARYIRDELSGIPDVTVILTRDGDYQMNLDTRAMIARNNNADLYVSLHINDESSHTARGSQMYVPFYEGQRHYNSEMTKLAKLFQEELSYIGISRNISGGIVKRNIDQIPKYQYLLNGQVVQADYYADIRHAMKGDTLDYGPDLTTETGVPAILVEHCFMNSSDSNFWDSDYDLHRIAQADANAIKRYFGL